MLRAVPPAVGLGWVFVLFAASPLAAQANANGSAAGRTGFLTNYEFHLNAARLVTDDERFTWDADLGGDIDLFDYGAGRLNLMTNFEAILGEQFRAFDPNQGTYTLGLSVSLRARGNELSLLYHHVSRHLSDRLKRNSIDWNMSGVTFSRIFTTDRLHLDTGARLLATLQRSFVDYRSEIGGHAVARHAVRPRVAIIMGLAVTARTVERRIFQRGTLVGGRVEGGVRLNGGTAAVELFVAWERRIDADPFDLITQRWTAIGFRFVPK